MKKNFFTKYNAIKASQIWSNLRMQIAKFYKKVKKFFKKHPVLMENLQFCLMYSYAIIILVFAIRNVYGAIPESITKIMPIINKIAQLPLFEFLATPEKTFLIYLISSELVLNRDYASLLIKFHMLLILILEMLQNLIISFWDLLVHREFEVAHDDFALTLAEPFFFIFFCIIFSTYVYCFIKAICGKYVSFYKPFEIITDSVAYFFELKRVDKKKEE